MAVRDDFTAGEVLAAADLNDTFAAKLNLAGGKVLQVVRATDTTLRSTTSTTFVDVTGMSVTITPQKTTSAIIVIFLATLDTSSGVDSANLGTLQITDTSNNALSGAQNNQFGVNNLTGTGARQMLAGANIWGYSTPATISPVTYKARFLSGNASVTFRVRNDIATGQMYAIEVSA